MFQENAGVGLIEFLDCRRSPDRSAATTDEPQHAPFQDIFDIEPCPDFTHGLLFAAEREGRSRAITRSAWALR